MSIKFFKNLLRGPTHIELAARELDVAKRAKLEAESAKEYAESIVAYNTARIARLEAYLRDQQS